MNETTQEGTGRNEMTTQELTAVFTEIENRGIDTSEIGCRSFDEILEAVNGPQAAEQEEPFGHCDSCGRVCDGSGQCACGGPIAVS